MILGFSAADACCSKTTEKAAHLAGFEMRVVRAHQAIYQIRRMQKPVLASVQGAAAGIRGDIARAYKAVEEPNAYRPADFRTALKSAAGAIGRLQ